MNILIDGYGLLPGPKGMGGAGRYLLSLLDGLSRLDCFVRVTTSLDNRKLFAGTSGVDVQTLGRQDEFSMIPHFRWADIYYAPLNGLQPIFIPHNLPVVACIHDLQHNVSPQYFSRNTWIARNRDYGYAIQRADRLIAISSFEKQNFATFFGKTAVDVVHHGGYLAEHYDSALAAKFFDQGLIPREEYCVYPAVAWPHKNHLRVIQALGLVKRTGRAPWKFVMTGAIEHELSQPEFLTAVDRLGLEKEVIVCGFVDGSLLAALIKHAKALVFPSLYEGFGIPLVEAMQLGTPVLAVRTTAVPEVVGEAGLYFTDGENPVAMARELCSFLNDPALLAAKSRAGLERGHLFSTEKMCRETLQVFERAIDRKKNATYAPLVSLKPEAFSRLESARLAILLVVSADDLTNDAELGSLGNQAEISAKVGDIFVFLPLTSDVRRIERAEEVLSSYNPKIFLFDDRADNGLVDAVRFANKTSIKTEYIMMRRITDRLLSPSQLDCALAELERLADLGGARAGDDNGAEFSVIRRPGDDKAVFEMFVSLRNDPMMRFWGWLLRRKLFEESDVPGTTRFLSYFLKNVSYLDLPTSYCL